MTPKEAFFGGAFYVTQGTSFLLRVGYPRLMIFKPTAGGLTVQLPRCDKFFGASAPAGSKIFPKGWMTLICSDPTSAFAFTVVDQAGGTISVVGIGQKLKVILVDNSTATGVWAFKRT